MNLHLFTFEEAWNIYINLIIHADTRQNYQEAEFYYTKASQVRYYLMQLKL